MEGCAPTDWRARLDRVRRPRGALGQGEFAARFRELATDADLLHLGGPTRVTERRTRPVIGASATEVTVLEPGIEYVAPRSTR